MDYLLTLWYLRDLLNADTFGCFLDFRLGLGMVTENLLP